MHERAAYFEGNNQRCTIKFRGKIDPWPKDVALGVEWDDSTRGKNSGKLGDKQYFTTKIPNSGSFVKADRQQARSLSLGEAVYSKYIAKYEFTEISLSDVKTVQTYDVERMHEIQSNTANLTSVSVNDCLVKQVSIEGHKELNFSNVKSLDLGNNLIETLSSVVSNLDELFSCLEVLILNGNRMVFDLGYVSKVASLELTNTLLSQTDIDVLGTVFPDLKSLSLAYNLLETADLPAELINSLEVWDISHNKLTELPPLPTNLRSLMASDNLITNLPDLDYRNWPASVDLSGNPLTWTSISELGDSPAIKDLKLFHIDLTLPNRPFAIARCPYLQVLDGIKITDEERRDAEIYTLACCDREEHEPLPPHIYQNLIKVHGRPLVSGSKSIAANLMRVFIDDELEPLQIVKHAPMYRLSVMISKRKDIKPFQLRINEIDPEVILSSMVKVHELIDDGTRVYTTHCDEIDFRVKI